MSNILLFKLVISRMTQWKHEDMALETPINYFEKAVPQSQDPHGRVRFPQGSGLQRRDLRARNPGSGAEEHHGPPTLPGPAFS